MVVGSWMERQQKCAHILLLMGWVCVVVHCWVLRDWPPRVVVVGSLWLCGGSDCAAVSAVHLLCLVGWGAGGGWWLTVVVVRVLSVF